MSEYDFEFRKLYDQNAKIEEGGFVCSRMYAISYMYPGAISRTTARCRMSLVYQYDDLGLIINGGNIEKWTDRGWMSVDEFFDAHVMFPDLENAFAYMLNMFKSFTLGIPVGLEGSRDPEPSPRTPPPGKKPKLRVLSFKDKTEKSAKDDNNYEDNNKVNKNEEPDFDWI